MWSPEEQQTTQLAYKAGFDPTPKVEPFFAGMHTVSPLNSPPALQMLPTGAAWCTDARYTDGAVYVSRMHAYRPCCSPSPFQSASGGKLVQQSSLRWLSCARRPATTLRVPHMQPPLRLRACSRSACILSAAVGHFQRKIV